MKKVLMLASVASMISQFNMNNIYLLKELGYEVHVACNFLKGNTCDLKSIDKLKTALTEIEVPYFQVDFSRSMKDISRNVFAYRQVNKLLKNNKYVFIHCHSPIGGVIGRIAGRNVHIKTVYTAHGFHFYKGSPLRNWMFYFPAEWFCSWVTDILITINREDYHFAKKYLHAKRVEYIPGIGIDLTQFEKIRDSNLRKRMRNALGIQDEETKVLLSVGELNKNKNQKVIVKALSKIKKDGYMYLICGEGKLKDDLQRKIERESLQDRIKLLGYRADIKEIYQAADIFVFPSKREGLSVALMEAMASGLPVICGRIRGNVDLIRDREGGILVDDVTKPKEFLSALKTMMGQSELCKSAGKINARVIRKFSTEEVNERMKEIYLSFDKRRL